MSVFCFRCLTTEQTDQRHQALLIGPQQTSSADRPSSLKVFDLSGF
jgi:hypothetical protein